MHDLAAIRDAQATLAAIIERDGPELLPLFLRLEAMEAEILADTAAMDRVRRMARERRAA